MAATFTLSGDLATIVGANIDPKAVEVYVEASEPAITDTTAHVTRVGSVKATVNADGTWEAPGLLATNATDIVPAPVGGETFKYRVLIRYRDARTITVKNLVTGWFDLTANTKFDAIDERELTTISAEFAENIIGDVQDAATAAIAQVASSTTAATSAASAASSSATAAQTAATAAQAVGTTNDTIIAGRITTPGSATATALSASIAAAVPPEVEEALANSSTLVASATEAVSDAVVGMHLVEATTTYIDDQSIGGIVDNSRRRTWVDIAPDGGPTDWAASLMAPKLAGPVGTAVGLFTRSTDTTGSSYAVVDSAGRLTDIELGEDGKFTDRALASIKPRLGIPTNIVTTTEYDCWGDSLTAGALGGGVTWPNTLQTLLAASGSTASVLNFGVGGETSRSIAGRHSGRPLLVTVPSGSIPGSGGVTVTLSGDDGVAVEGGATDGLILNQGSVGVNPCELVVPGAAGPTRVMGTLALSGGVYTFTRSAAGSAVSVNVPVPLYTAASRDNRRGELIMWMGQNDNTTDATEIIARQRAMIERQNTIEKKFLVIGLSTGSAASRASMEAQFLRAYGRRFINIRAYLGSAASLADAGITPTSADNTAISNGSVPPSLLGNPGGGDVTHLGGVGYGLVGRQVFNRLKELGDA